MVSGYPLKCVQMFCFQRLLSADSLDSFPAVSGAWGGGSPVVSVENSTIEQCFWTRADLPPSGHLEMSGNVFGCHSLCLGRGCYRYLVGRRKGTLWNIVQCRGQCPATKNHLAPHASSAKAENPCCKWSQYVKFSHYFFFFLWCCYCWSALSLSP